MQLLETDQRFHLAIDVAAGNQLFQMVVDTDSTAAFLVKEMQKANAGRVTFMPLNILKQRMRADPEYPVSEDVIPMASRLRYAAEFEPALKQVFRKAVIVRTLDIPDFNGMTPVFLSV